MSDVSAHRKAIAKAMIRTLRAECDKSIKADSNDLAFGVEEEEDDTHINYDNCVVTDLFFPDDLSVTQITMSNYGGVFMALWLGENLFLHDGENLVSRRKGGEFHGNTLFPRWLAEAINEECVGLDIAEEDIY